MTEFTMCWERYTDVLIIAETKNDYRVYAQEKCAECGVDTLTLASIKSDFDSALFDTMYYHSLCYKCLVECLYCDYDLSDDNGLSHYDTLGEQQ